MLPSTKLRPEQELHGPIKVRVLVDWPQCNWNQSINPKTPRFSTAEFSNRQNWVALSELLASGVNPPTAVRTTIESINSLVIPRTNVRLGLTPSFVVSAVHLRRLYRQRFTR